MPASGRAIGAAEGRVGAHGLRSRPYSGARHGRLTAQAPARRSPALRAEGRHPTRCPELSARLPGDFTSKRAYRSPCRCTDLRPRRPSSLGLWHNFCGLARRGRSVRWTQSGSAAVPTGFEPADRWEQVRPVSVSRRGRDLFHVDRNGPLCHGTAACGNARTPAPTQGRGTVLCGRIFIRDTGNRCHGSTEVVPEPSLVNIRSAQDRQLLPKAMTSRCCFT